MAFPVFSIATTMKDVCKWSGLIMNNEGCLQNDLYLLCQQWRVFEGSGLGSVNNERCLQNDLYHSINKDEGSLDICMIDPTGNISYVLYVSLIPQAIFHMYCVYDWSQKAIFYMYCMYDWSHRQYFICTVCMIDCTCNISYVLYVWLIPQAIFHMYDWSNGQYFICTIRLITQAIFHMYYIICMIDPTGNISYVLYVRFIPLAIFHMSCQTIFHMYCMYDWSYRQYFICTVCMIDPTGNISYVLYVWLIAHAILHMYCK